MTLARLLRVWFCVIMQGRLCSHFKLVFLLMLANLLSTQHRQQLSMNTCSIKYCIGGPRSVGAASDFAHRNLLARTAGCLVKSEAAQQRQCFTNCLFDALIGFVSTVRSGTNEL